MESYKVCAIGLKFCFVHQANVYFICCLWALNYLPVAYSHTLITRQIGLYEQDSMITGLTLCLGIQPSAEQFTSALIATASTAGPNGVHDQEI